MKKYYRIEVFRDYVKLFMMKQDGLPELKREYSSLNSCFHENRQEFKPSDFRISEDSFVPITLQNF